MLGEDRSLRLPASGSWQHSLAHGGITPVSASAVTWPLLCMTSPSICLIQIHVTAFGPHPDSPGYSPRAKSLNLIVSSNTLFPDEVTFTASRDWDLVSLGGHFFTYPVLWLKEG